MPFPTDEQLELYAEAALGADLTADPSTWAWTVLTCTHPSDAARTISRLTDAAISIRKGVAVGGSQQQTTSATIEMFNHDGALTPGLASSPYWPYIDAGTPIRLRLRSTTATKFGDTFTRTVASGFGTSDSGFTYSYYAGTTGDLSTNGSTGRITHPTVNVLRLALVNSAFQIRDSDALIDFSLPALATGAPISVGVEARGPDSINHLWCTAEMQVGGGIFLQVRVAVAGVYTTLATTAGSVGTYTANVLQRLRVQVVADRVRMKIWPASSAEPSVWHLDIRQTNFAAAGRWGIQTWTQVGNSNTHPYVITVDNVQITQPPYDRVEGYIADVRPTFKPIGGGVTWSTAQVDIAGIGMLLEKQQAPSYSPMRRSVQQATLPPIAYWPLEDDEGATFGASAFPGGNNMIVAGPAVFGFSQGVPTAQYLSRFGTKPMVSVAAGARLTGVVPQSLVVDEWAVSLVAEFLAPDVPGITELRVAQWETPSGTQNRWAVVAPVAGGYLVRAYSDATGTVTDVASYGSTFVGQFTITVEGHQSGGNVAVELFINDFSLATGSIAGTQGPVTRVTVNPDRTNTTASLTPDGLKFVAGHVRVVDEISVPDTPFYTVSETSQVVSAIDAWYQEPAHRRLERLCTEERVPFQYRGSPGTTGMTILNAQQDGSFTSLTEAAVEAESGGLLYEHRFGYEYLPRSARYNQSSKLVINMATYGSGTDPEDVLVPQLDSRAANFWTISRTNGSSGSWAADAAYRKRRGTITEERTLDVLTDDVLTDHASWRVHLGVDGAGANYPSILLDLAANPALIEAWLGCLLGDRVQRTNQPGIAGVGTIDQVVVGYTETITPWSWDVVMSAQPATVWDVGVWDDGVSRWSPNATTLSSGMTTTVLSLTMAGEPWTTGAVVILLEIDGEQMTTSNISGSGNGPYTVTLSARSVNGVVKAHVTGATVNLANPTHWAL